MLTTLRTRVWLRRGREGSEEWGGGRANFLAIIVMYY